MRAELELIGVSTDDIQSVTSAPTSAEAQTRLDNLKNKARRRYHELALELHPDRTGGDEEKAKQFKAVSEIYEQFMELRPMPRRPEPLVMNHGIVVTFGGTSSVSATMSESIDGLGWTSI